MSICPECGQAFDGDRCWVCAARKADIDETFSLSLPVALAGISIGNILAIFLYPPLVSGFPVVYAIPALFFVGAIIYVLVVREHLTRYAKFIRLLIVLVTVSFVLQAAYFLLNGILDGNPAVEVPSSVIRKVVAQGKCCGPVLVVSLSWNRQIIGQNINVGRDMFASVKPGESVRVVIHSGAFSQPWYSDVLLSDDRARDSK